MNAQRLLSRCPGFIGADGAFRVVVEPAYVVEAMTWLKRRFHVSENLDLSDNGLCIDLRPRERRVVGSVVRRSRISFKPEQFELKLT